MSLPPPAVGSAALVTGASSGIGVEFARLLAADGHALILVARRLDRLEELAAELRAAHGVRVEALRCDLADPDDRQRLYASVSETGLAVEILVNNAGFGLLGRFVEADIDRLHTMLRTNVEAVVELSHRWAPDMVRRRRGAIAIVSSINGLMPVPGMAVYGASKAAALSFGEALSAELGPAGVAVTTLCPGPVDTEFNAVADAQETSDRIPGLVKASPRQCAEEALDALRGGRRVVVPNLAIRLSAPFLRHVPRTPLLAAVRRAFGAGAA